MTFCKLSMTKKVKKAIALSVVNLLLLPSNGPKKVIVVDFSTCGVDAIKQKIHCMTRR